MRRVLFLMAVFICFNAVADECKTKYSAIVLENKGNRIIYENRADQLIYPASLTKVMTLYLAFEALRKNELQWNQEIPISGHSEDISAINRVTTLHLQEGDKITVRDAVRAAAVKSMNGAAVALAEAISGSEWEFAKKMNEKARKMEMFHTNFRNATGLHADGQYSTAYDLARLLVAMQKKFPEHKKYFSQKDFDYKGFRYKTHNHFVVDYKGATGFKTGFTSKSGFNLMATAKRKGRDLSGVIVGCETHQVRDNYSQELFDEAFAVARDDNYRKKEIKISLKSVFE